MYYSYPDEFRVQTVLPQFGSLEYQHPLVGNSELLLRIIACDSERHLSVSRGRMSTLPEPVLRGVIKEDTFALTGAYLHSASKCPTMNP